MWMVIKFTNHFMYWWTLWAARGGVEWNFPRFIFLALPAVVLYLQATVLTSSTPRTIRSWREHYYSIAPLFFGLNLVFALLSNSFLWVVADLPISMTTIATFSAIALASIAAMVSRKPWIHVVVVSFLAGLNVLVFSTLAFSPLPLD
jgi:hypothetical protein